MDNQGSHRIEHAECVAYYRNALSARRSLQVRSWLDAHPQAAVNARADADHEQAIASAVQHVLHEPIPQRLRVQARLSAGHRLERVALAATIVLAAAGGWWLGGAASVDGEAPSDFTTRVAHAARQQPLSARAVRDSAQKTASVDGPGIESAAGVTAPNLTMRGYELIQQQRLATNAPPLVEFVYRNASGERLRIYAEADADRHTGPSIVKRDGLALAQWREGGIRYALVGDQPEQSLQALAQTARTHSKPEESQFASVEQWSAVSAAADDTGANGSGLQPAPTLNDGSPSTSMNRSYGVRPSSM